MVCRGSASMPSSYYYNRRRYIWKFRVGSLYYSSSPGAVSALVRALSRVLEEARVRLLLHASEESTLLCVAALTTRHTAPRINKNT